MHLHRIGLPVNGKVMGGMALGLGSVMVFGAIMGAAAVSFSQEDGYRVPLLAAVHLSAPLSMSDFLVACTFTIKRAALLRLNSEHSQQHQRPNPPHDTNSLEKGSVDQFGRVYDQFIFMALAFSVLEMLIFHLGRRRLSDFPFNSQRGQRGGAVTVGAGALDAGPLRSLLDEEDLREAAWESRGIQNQILQQDLDMQQRCEQLRRMQLEKSEGVLAQHARGGIRNTTF
ncbi:unnamed protein product [Sphacelaria rigidula]